MGLGIDRRGICSGGAGREINSVGAVKTLPIIGAEAEESWVLAACSRNWVGAE
jgi:hypothetical protein